MLIWIWKSSIHVYCSDSPNFNMWHLCGHACTRPHVHMPARARAHTQRPRSGAATTQPLFIVANPHPTRMRAQKHQCRVSKAYLHKRSELKTLISTIRVCISYSPLKLECENPSHSSETQILAPTVDNAFSPMAAIGSIALSGCRHERGAEERWWQGNTSVAASWAHQGQQQGLRTYSKANKK